MFFASCFTFSIFFILFVTHSLLMSEGVAEMLREDAEKNNKSMEQAGVDFVMSNRPSSIIERLASVEEVANMIVYACSKQASATTGGALRVDGGVVDSICP